MSRENEPSATFPVGQDAPPETVSQERLDAASKIVPDEDTEPLPPAFLKLVTKRPEIPGLDAVLLAIPALHPRARTLAKEAILLLRDAFQISAELSGLEAQAPSETDDPSIRYQYVVHETRDALDRTLTYGLLLKERVDGVWSTAAVVAPFSHNRWAVTALAKRCTDQQLSPDHLLDVVHDFMVQDALP